MIVVTDKSGVFSDLINGGPGTDTLRISYTGATSLGDFSITSDGDDRILTDVNGGTIRYSGIEVLEIGSNGYTEVLGGFGPSGQEPDPGVFWSASEHAIYLYDGGRPVISSLSGLDSARDLLIRGSDTNGEYLGLKIDSFSLNLTRGSGALILNLLGGDDSVDSVNARNIDQIDLGAGDDYFAIQAGKNGTPAIADLNLAKLDGGPGFDTLSFVQSVASTTPLNLSVAGATNFEGLMGTSGTETITGDSQDNILLGYGGSDTIEGGDGSDHLAGSGQRRAPFGDRALITRTHFLSNVSYYKGICASANGQCSGLSSDTLTLRGGNGDDLMFGGRGQDLLDGGPGADAMLGGQGADTFVLRAGDGSKDLAEADVVYDFEDGSDVFLMSGGLEFIDLDRNPGTGEYSGDAVIRNGVEILVIVKGVGSESLTIADFN